MGTKTPISFNELAIYKSKSPIFIPIFYGLILKKTCLFKLKHESELTKSESYNFTR